MKVTWTSAVLAFSLTATATPIAKRNLVEEVAHGTRWVSPAIIYNETLAQLGQNAPEGLKRAAARDLAALEHNEKVKRGEKMSIKVVPGFLDTDYLVPVTIGKQKMNVEIDTGSVQTWVFSTLLAPEDRGSHILYNPGNKAPLDPYRTFFRVEDDERGHAWGLPYEEQVTLGSFTAPRAHVGAADTMSQSLVRKQSDGSIGMALDWAFCDGFCDSFLQSSPFNGKSYLQKFAVDMRANGPSTWEFGSWDEASYPFSKQSWAPVVMSITGDPFINDEGKWLLYGGNCLINGKKDANTKCGHHVIVSTSSPLILLPINIVDYYYSKVSGAKFDDESYSWVFPCSTSLPSFGFTFDSVNHPEGNIAPGASLNMGPLNDGTGRCFGAIQRTLATEYNVIGTSFLKNFYVAFEAYLEKGVPNGGAVMFAPKKTLKKPKNT